MIVSGLVIFILLLIGWVIYTSKPKFFWIYWLSIYPYVLPLLYLLLKPFLTPMYERFQPILEYYPSVILLFISFLIFRHILTSKLKIFRLPIALLFLFLILQNIFVGVDVKAFLLNIKDVLCVVIPCVLLIINRKIRPNRTSFLKYIYFFILIQTFFCILNSVGFKIYDEMIEGGFEEHLICGTFTRYNHMANFLSVFFFILIYEYHEHKSLQRDKFLLSCFIIALLIFLSGSRMTLLLLLYIMICIVYIYYGKRYILLFFLLLVSLFFVYIKNNEIFIGQNADEGTGIERNVIGVIDLANSDDLSEGSTLALSANLFMNYFNSPFIGNGKDHRSVFFYGNPALDPFAGSYKNDARLAFMLVEYGIIGLSLFLFLFSSTFKACLSYSEEKSNRLYFIAFFYFLLFSITDAGFWDAQIFSCFFVYVFSSKTNKNLKSLQ